MSKNTTGQLLLRDIHKSFGGKPVLAGVSLSVEQGEFLSLLGPSGCGKTTLLRIIAGLEKQDSGAVRLGERDLSPLPPAQRGFGIVFQSYALFPNLTVVQNVAFGLKGGDRSAGAGRVGELLALVGLGDFARRYPAQLSGGQQQRVALARALAPAPRLLLLDEPFSALDAKVRVGLREEMRQLQRQLGLTTILVTHDQEEALCLSDRVAVMHGGQVAQWDRPEVIYQRPANAFVADFVGAMNFLPQAAPKGEGCYDVQGVRLSAQLVAAGGPVTLAIRPHDVALAPGAGDNVLPGRLLHVEYLGGVYRLLVETGFGKMRVDVPPAVRQSLGADPAGEVWLRLPAENLLVLDGAA